MTRRTHESTRERPILFSAQMVRAILDGRKTMTRRVFDTGCISQGCVVRVEHLGGIDWRFITEMGNDYARKNKFGEPGQRLWVRETFAKGVAVPIYRADWGEPDHANHYPAHPQAGWLDEIQKTCGADVCDHEWKPSIHMPRTASRITLGITAVKVERLLEISVNDAAAEGVDWHGGPFRAGHTNPISAFHSLWDSINGKGSWDANPWVWCISFKRVQP